MRPLYLAGGILSVAFGAIGAVLPIMPTVPFLLLAVFCFARSNPEWERKILEHPQWGPQIADWRDHRIIRRPAKLAAVAAMSAGVLFTWATLGAPWVYVSLSVLIIAGGWIVTRNE
ncbi:YbaN family protein [Erythrobacter litoralis]|uniref:DUF454 domain-containing protein n=1 Tax=Erythrobacter litoralis (strain HTCC2594) TaxID=314225 RepID=Q2NC32_ERYLH|nr:YbaN family protein [Erythrobacter litoralis]ABC62759.1 hypothetical protein ELI_03335 [Erythrobacter litoralis HTCC2594]